MGRQRREMASTSRMYNSLSEKNLNNDAISDFTCEEYVLCVILRHFIYIAALYRSGAKDCY